MPAPYIVKQTKSYQPIHIDKVEENYDATYVGDFCIRTKRGGWSEEPVAIFYVANPDTEQGHKHYFGLFVRDGSIYITDGTSAFSEPIVGVVTPDGEVLYSRFCHDYREKDGVMIDGGRDYVRRSGTGRMVHVVADGPDLKVVDIPVEDEAKPDTITIPTTHKNEWTDGPAFIIDFDGCFEGEPNAHYFDNTFDATVFILTTPMNATFKVVGTVAEVEELAKRFPTRDVRHVSA